MDTTDVTRLLIDTAVSRGIKDMTNDPKRSIRRLADLGKQFSTGTFQQTIIDIIQTLLKNDDSPYYDLISDFLANTDHTVIKDFGINVGYYSWTYGARLIRSNSEKNGFYYPWALILHYDPQAEDNGGLSADAIEKIINEAVPLGIYSFFIFQDSGIIASDKLLELFSRHKHCGFLYFLSEAQVTAAQEMKIKKYANTLLSINASSSDAHETCSALREDKVLYSIHYNYTNHDVTDTDSHERLIEHIESFNSGLFFGIQSDKETKNAGAEIKKARMEQLYPCFAWDLYSDMRDISRIICGNPDTLLMIGSDGRIMVPEDTGLNFMNENESLEHVLSEVMPKFSE